jgi:hypothetical protein
MSIFDSTGPAAVNVQALSVTFSEACGWRIVISPDQTLLHSIATRADCAGGRRS